MSAAANFFRGLFADIFREETTLICLRNMKASNLEAFSVFFQDYICMERMQDLSFFLLYF